jgi:hypothetical protein
MPSVARKAITERFVGSSVRTVCPGRCWSGLESGLPVITTNAGGSGAGGKERLTEEGRQEVQKYRSEPVREQFSTDHAYVPGRKLLCNAVIL